MPEGFQRRPTDRRMAEDPLVRAGWPAPADVLPEYRVQLAGPTFAEVGQPALQYMQRMGRTAFEGEGAVLSIYMAHEPENEHDPYALRVMLKSIRDPKEVKLGYVPNKERKCLSCGHEYAATRIAKDAVTVCLHCGGPVRRDGVAFKICQAAANAGLRPGELYRAFIDWDGNGVVGGGARTHGLCLRISPHQKAGGGR